MEKICKSCGEVKDLSCFKKNKGCSDGYENKCKVCVKKRAQERLANNIDDCPSEKKCNTCERLLPIEMYSKNKALKYGYSNRCKECDKKVWSVYKENNKEKINKEYVDRYHSDPEFRQHRLSIGKKVYDKRALEKPESFILQSAKSRAKARNLDFNLELSDIIIPEFCPILGIKLERGGQIFNSPSIDRIDPLKGYIKGNIRIISQRANTMKNDASIKEMQTFCENIIKYMNNEDIVRTVEKEESTELEDKEPLG